MNKIYIYEAETLRKRVTFKNTIVNYVKLTRPEGLEEHWPKTGDFINLYHPGDIFYMRYKIIGKKNDDIYIVDFISDNEIKINVKIENLKDEGLESLLNLPRDISNEIEGLSKLTNEDVDLNKNLTSYADISKNIVDNEFFYEIIKTYFIKAIKDKIKDIDVWVDMDHYGNIEVYTNEPTIEEVIDKDYNTNEGIIKFKGIIEREVHIYRIVIKTNIYKK